MKKGSCLILCLGLLSYSSLFGRKKRAIVIGASAGIGKEVAKILAKNKYAVGVTARRYPLLQALQKESSGDMSIAYMDVSNVDDARKRFVDLIKKMGGLDLVVINAGSMRTHSWDLKKETIATNVTGFVAIADCAKNFFTKQGHGHIVGISSVDAVRGIAGGSVYSGSKAFVANYLEGLRNGFVQNGYKDIYVTEIRPGYVRTHEMPSCAYWVLEPETAAADIYKSIQAKHKVAYTTRRWWIIACLLAITPDFIYNKIGGF